MKIIFEIRDDNKVRLILKEGNKVLIENAWQECNNLSRKMLSKMDQILGRKKIGLDKISGCEIISKVPKSWTSCRIAKSVFDSFAIAKKFQR